MFRVFAPGSFGFGATRTTHRPTAEVPAWRAYEEIKRPGNGGRLGVRGSRVQMAQVDIVAVREQWSSGGRRGSHH